MIAPFQKRFVIKVNVSQKISELLAKIKGSESNKYIIYFIS